jgi:hypothetical protein
MAMAARNHVLAAKNSLFSFFDHFSYNRILAIDACLLDAKVGFDANYLAL